MSVPFKYAAMKLTPIRAIRRKCLDCSYGSYKEIEFCPIESCPLWPYRMGRRPKTHKEVQLAKTHKQA